MSKRRLPSLLDRLAGTEPPEVDGLGGGEGLNAYRQIIIRDLTDLLNSRRTVAIPEGAGEVGKSVVAYGLTDLTTMNVKSAPDIELLAREIERTIVAFEPRLRGVRVTPGEPRTSGADVDFRINAVLRLEPVPIEVHFDTRLDGSTRNIAIADSG
jgi:type VI secretion system protein ImpF